jgi:hypothetical protein
MVDFPQPEGPTNATFLPLSSLRLNFLKSSVFLVAYLKDIYLS